MTESLEVQEAQRTLTRLIRPHGKGQITIPVEFRRRLGIDERTILRLELRGSRIEITPSRLSQEEGLLRDYAPDEIEAFLHEDRIDKATAAKVRRLLRG